MTTKSGFRAEAQRRRGIRIALCLLLAGSVYAAPGWAPLPTNATDQVPGPEVGTWRTHAGATNNPHKVTAAQVGAVGTNDARILTALTNLTGAAIAAAGGLTNAAAFATAEQAAALQARTSAWDTASADATTATSAIPRLAALEAGTGRWDAVTGAVMVADAVYTATVALAAAAYPSSNPSGYVDRSAATAGMQAQSNNITLVIESIPAFSKYLEFQNQFTTQYVALNGTELLLGTQPGFGERIATTADISTVQTNAVDPVSRAANILTSNAIPNADSIWQAAHVIDMATNRYSITLGGSAESTVQGEYWLLTNNATWYGATGTLTITTIDGSYLVSVTASKRIANNTNDTPGTTIYFDETRSANTQIVFSAKCGDGGVGMYYAAISNITAQTYDRAMTPGTLTNDAPAIVARVDAPGAADERGVVNRATLVSYVAAQASGISSNAWDWTPSGARRPTRDVCVIDLPMIQQGNITYLQAGDSYCQSALGGSYAEVTTGSVWRIGPAGRTAFEIASTNHMLEVSEFTLITNQLLFVVSTNYATIGTPTVEFCEDMGAQLWIALAGVTATNMTTNWILTATATLDKAFYRVISVGGDNRITSKYKHYFELGVSGLTAGDVGAVSNSAAGIAAAGGLVETPYQPYTSTGTVASGTCTVTFASGSLVKLEATESPTTLTFDNSCYATNGVNRVAIELLAGTNSIAFATATITNSVAPTISTSTWTKLIFRRSGNDATWIGGQVK